MIDRAITYLGEDKRRTQFFVKNSVNPEGKSFSFSWKVTKSQNSSLIFGLVDINKQKDARTSYDSGHAIAYNGLNGNVCYQKGKTISGGKGLKEGETIKMEVNLETQKVMWSCGSEIRGIVDGSMLKEKGRNFVPYVEIYDKEDCIEWINWSNKLFFKYFSKFHIIMIPFLGKWQINESSFLIYFNNYLKPIKICSICRFQLTRWLTIIPI